MPSWASLILHSLIHPSVHRDLRHLPSFAESRTPEPVNLEQENVFGRQAGGQTYKDRQGE